MADDTQQLVASRYRLVERLGRGGMGEVWEAEDTVLGRRVAVKVIDLQRTGDRGQAEIRARALREGRAAAQIDHPHSVRVFDVVDEDDLLYLVMELVRATPLDVVVDRDGPLDPHAAASMGLDVLDALAAAHRAGVVHRDVKPGNVMVLPDGSVKLSDFGIASLTEDPDLTATGLVLGTPKYLSPEAARGERAGAAADVWGLGALLYYAVEGRPPFERDGTLPTLHAVINEQPRPTARAGALAPVIDALLEKDPMRRPDDAAARRLLERALADDGTTVADAAPASFITTDTAPTRRVVPREPRSPQRGRRGGVLLAGLAALVLLGALALVVARQRDDGGRTTATTTTLPATTSTPPSTTATTQPATTTTPTSVVGLDRPDGVPADWIPYDGAGWRVWHPATWTPRSSGASQVDLVDATSGQYLRIGSVHPASNGGDPVKAWEEQEKAFAARHPDYERVRIERVDYRDYDAAVWEYTFEGQHADDLGFVVGETGYALNFVTSQDAWDSTAELRDAFRAGFEPSA